MCINKECKDNSAKIFSKGKCRNCYQRDYYNSNESAREKAKQRNAKRYKNPETRKIILDYSKRPEVKARHLQRDRKRRATVEDKESRWERRATVYHGLTREKRNKILELQKYMCPICEKPLSDKEAVVDHDHKCCKGKKSCGKCVRGLLHSTCNSRVLAVFENCAKELLNAKIYIKTQETQQWN